MNPHDHSKGARTPRVRRPVQIHVAVSSEELASLDGEAEAEGISRSDVVRRRIRGVPIHEALSISTTPRVRA